MKMSAARSKWGRRDPHRDPSPAEPVEPLAFPVRGAASDDPPPAEWQPCTYCTVVAPVRGVAVLDPERGRCDWRLCEHCRALLDLGLRSSGADDDPAAWGAPDRRIPTVKEVRGYFLRGICAAYGRGTLLVEGD